MLPETVVSKLEALPAQPGCYLFRDKAGEVVYVGKAKSLRSRVRSYFNEGSSDNRAFIPLLRRTIGDLDTVVVGSEKEAAILELALIKEHRPRYNVKLRDDKEFLSLRLNTSARWPRLEVVRRPRTDGARYFGPFPSSTSARRTLHLVNKYFQLRTCTDSEFAARKRPCLQYQIKRCPGPCVLEVDRDHYDAQVGAVALFLEGRHDELSVELDTRMRASARAMDYERAAVYRDQLKAIDNVREGQRLVGEKSVDQDVIGLYRQTDLVEVAVVYIRGGRVRDTTAFALGSVELPDDEVIASFVRDYYDEGGGGAGTIPDEILVPVLPEGADGVAEWLSEKRGRAVALIAPQRGRKVELLALANENAEHSFREKRRERDDVERRLVELQKKLRLPTPPRRIECVDISHLGGQDTVGAIVALRDGQPDKSRYKVFRVRGTAAGDDYAAMYEVLARRFRRGRDASRGTPSPTPAAALASWPGASNDERFASDEPERRDDASRDSNARAVVDVDAGAAREADATTDVDEASATEVSYVELTPTPPPVVAADSAGAAYEAPEPPPAAGSHGALDAWSLPDLLVVDGGRGQLNVALAAARDLGLTGLPIVGLAKERQTVSGEELVDRVYLPGQKNGIPLRPQSPSLFYLARARDEAHRFSNYARERLAKSRTFRSALDDVPGISKRVKVALLTAFGSVVAVQAATDEQLLEVAGIGRRAVTSLRAYWGPPKPFPGIEPAASPVADGGVEAEKPVGFPVRVPGPEASS